MSDQEPTAGLPRPTRSRRLWLVRHGLTAWNASGRLCRHTDLPLDATGRAQARWLGRMLRRHPVVAICTSDLARAQETATHIAAALPQTVPVLVSSAWREIGFGAWEGLTYADIAGTYGDQLAFFSDPDRHRPPGGESLAEVWSRVETGFALLAAMPVGQADGDIVLVSHGGTLRLLLCRLLALPVEQQWRLRLDPGSLSAVDLLLDETPGPAQGVLTLLNMRRPERT